MNLSFKCFVFNSEHNRGEKSRKWPLQGLVKGKAWKTINSIRVEDLNTEGGKAHLGKRMGIWRKGERGQPKESM